MHGVGNHTWVKTFHFQHIPIDCNTKEHKKLIDLASNSTLLLTFKETSIVEFPCSNQRRVSAVT